MAFREKLAWGVLASMVVVWGYYYGYLFWHVRSAGDVGGMLFTAVFWQTVITIAATVVAAISSPREANAPQDERDRRIASRASATAYYVLLCALPIGLAGAFAYHLKGGDIVRTQTMVVPAAIILAECVRYVLQIIQYRRGL